LESVRDLIKHVASEMKKKNPNGGAVFPTVYSLCAIHAARNAKIYNSNQRSLVVQWAKCGNLEDQDLKEKQWQSSSAKMTDAQVQYMKKQWEDVTYVGLQQQNLQTNFEVVNINSFNFELIVIFNNLHYTENFIGYK